MNFKHNIWLFNRTFSSEYNSIEDLKIALKNLNIDES